MVHYQDTGKHKETQKDIILTKTRHKPQDSPMTQCNNEYDILTETTYQESSSRISKNRLFFNLLWHG